MNNTCNYKGNDDIIIRMLAFHATLNKSLARKRPSRKRYDSYCIWEIYFPEGLSVRFYKIK